MLSRSSCIVIRTIMTMKLVLLLLLSVVGVQSFVGPSRSSRPATAIDAGIFKAIGEFFEELDAFMDDASARRLGNGAAFYGKRKSSFYGKDDKMRKMDKNTVDPTEDYQGPSNAGYFQWMPDENGEMRPVTRMKNRIVEKRVGSRED